MKRTEQLKTIINSHNLEFLMEGHNGLSAKIVEETGFKGIWASGLSISASLGVRDNNEAFMVNDKVQFVPYDYDLDPQTWFGKKGDYTEFKNEDWFRKYLGKYLDEMPEGSQEKKIAKNYLKKKINLILLKVPAVIDYISKSKFKYSKEINQTIKETISFYLSLL